MNAILEQINSTGKVFVEFAWPMLVQSSVLTAVLLLADLALRRKVRAVFRYWLWMIVLVKLILPTSLSSPLSVGYWFGDELKYKDIGRATTGAEAVVGTQKPAIVKEVEPQSAGAKAMMEPAAVDAAGPIVAETTAGEAMASVTQVTWEGIVFVVWAAVAAAMVLLLVQRAVFVCGLVRQGRDANNLMKDVLDYCRGQMGVRGKVGLKVSANATSPAVCGLFRPVILVPQNLGSELGSSHLRVVLLHELAHIKRGDLWVNLVQTVLQIVYFYNPLLWAANAVIRRVREQAVDESVLVAMGEKAQQYPQTLIDVAKLAFKRPALSLRLIGVVESKSALKGRIKHILNRPMPRSAKLGILGLVGVLIFGAVALPMAKFERGPAGFVVRGTVTDAETGKSVGGAKVGDVNEYAGGKQWTTSDANGNYSYKTWYEEHGVKAEADGYKRQDKGFGTKLFGKEKEKVIDFMLVPEKDKNESEFKATKPTEDTEKNQRDGSAKFQPLVKIDVTEKDLQNTFEFTRMPQGFGLKGIRYFSRLGPNRFKLTVFYETGLPVEEIQAVDSEGNMHPSIEKAVGLGNAEGIFTFSADKLAGIVLGSREESSGQNLPTNINKFSATLPNGVTVELVGICEHPSEGKQWWRPDGSKLEEKPWEKINGSVSPGWGKKACEFALKLAYPTEQEPGYYVKVESQGSVASGVTHTTATGHLNWLAVELPSKLEKTNITVAIASGKWQTQFSRSASEQGGVYAESSILGKGVAWFSPSSTDGKTSLTVSHGFTELETRAVAIDSSGHEHAGQYQSALFKSDSDTRTI
jgi:bla regulator protein BlaR1